MKSINQQAPVQCSKSIVINAGKAKVWAVLTNINEWAAWQTDITRPVFIDPLETGATFTWKTGGAVIRSTLHTVAPHHQFGWTGSTFGMTAIHNWTLTEKDGKTEVQVEESMESLLAVWFKKVFNKNLEKGMVNWLDLLKQACEKGKSTFSDG